MGHIIDEISSEKIKKHAKLWIANLEPKYRFSSSYVDNSENFCEMVFRKLNWTYEKEIFISISLDIIKIHVLTMLHDNSNGSNSTQVYDHEFKI